ncbi:hypothetical protein [Streptomyces sp. NPDC052042]
MQRTIDTVVATAEGPVHGAAHDGPRSFQGIPVCRPAEQLQNQGRGYQG